MDIFRGVTECQVRAGDTILMWKDPWTKPPLSESSAGLFSYTSNPNISVREFVEEENPGIIFQLPLSMEAHAELLSLLTKVHADMLVAEEPDV
jgi:hypothetical protein